MERGKPIPFVFKFLKPNSFRVDVFQTLECSTSVFVLQLFFKKHYPSGTNFGKQCLGRLDVASRSSPVNSRTLDG